MTHRTQFRRFFSVLNELEGWAVANEQVSIDTAIERATDGKTGEVQIKHSIVSCWLDVRLRPDGHITGYIDTPLDSEFWVSLDERDAGFVAEVADAYDRITNRYATSPYVSAANSPTSAAMFDLPPEIEAPDISQAVRNLDRIAIAVVGLNSSLHGLVRTY